MPAKLTHWAALVAGSALATIAVAKLPTPVLTDEQKAKAAEAKEKAAEAAKKEAADVGRYQDRVADRYFRDMKAAGKTVPPATWTPPPAPVAAAPQPSSSEAHGQKQAAAPKTQNTAAPPAKAPAAKR